MSDLTGLMLNGYQIHEKIGEGGYGVVYRAHELSVNRDVAIKVILPDFASQPDFLQNFEAEAKLIARLEDPHIIPLYHFWEDDHGIFLVMRYVRDGSLRERLQKQQRLSIAETLRILSHITTALSVAHQVGVVHRDLKPDNILLDERGNGYLTDFGLAKRLDADTSLDDPDTLVGTPAYLAPEQILSQPVSPQTDVYALGVMLYEMLAGTHPFPDTPLLRMLQKHLQDPLPLLHPLRPDLSSEIDAIIQKATAKKASERYTGVMEVYEAFRKYASSNAIAIVEEAITERYLPAGQQNRLPVTPEARNRHNMLQNVRKFWIDGVLNNSLYKMTLIELGMKRQSNRIDHPWEVSLQIFGNASKTEPVDVNILKIFDQFNGKFLILGEPGSGKTTLLLELTQMLLHRAQLDDAHPIPVVFNLSSWSQHKKPLTEWLAAELSSKYQVPTKVAQAWVENDALLILLDGLDEVAADQREGCVTAINAYRSEHGFVDLVVCSRIIDYDGLTNRLKLNGAVIIQPLDDAQINKYITRLGLKADAIQNLLTEDETIRELYRSPLMLNIAILAWENTDLAQPTDDTSDKARRDQLFSVYVKTMFERRARNIHYPVDKMSKFIVQLAQYMQTRGQTVFLIENLQSDWLPRPYKRQYIFWFCITLIVIQTLIWGVPRYLTADFAQAGAPAIVRGAAWGLAGAIWGFILGMGLFRQKWSALLAGVVFGMAVSVEAITGAETSSLIIRLIPSVVIYTIMFAIIEHVIRRSIPVKDQIRSMEPLRFQRSGIPLALYAAGCVGGVATSVLNSIAYASTTLTTQDRIVGMGLGAVVSGLVTIYIASFVGGEVRNAVRPNEGMYQTFFNSLKMGFIVTAGLSISLLVTTVPVSSLTFGLVQIAISAIPFGFTGLLAYGGYYVLQHLILRYMLYRSNRTPLNLVRFLDNTVDLVFMRRVGGSYIFIHRYLLEYFANLEHPQPDAE